MKVKYFGHSCFLLEFDGIQVLMDPFLSANPLAKELPWMSLKPDFVLVTHAHYDHILDAEFFLKKGATLVSNFEIGSWMLKKGDYKVIKMNLGAKIDLPFGRLRMTAAYHSSTLPDGLPGGNPGGYLIENGGKRIYFAGDTGLGPYIEFIGKHWPPDLAFLPISGKVVLDAEDAFIAANWLNCAHIIGMHYNAFPDLTIDLNTARDIFDKGNKKLSLLTPGETTEF